MKGEFESLLLCNGQIYLPVGVSVSDAVAAAISEGVPGAARAEVTQGKRRDKPPALHEALSSTARPRDASGQVVDILASPKSFGAHHLPRQR